MIKNQLKKSTIILTFLIVVMGCSSDKISEPEIDINNYGLNTRENRLEVISVMKDQARLKKLHVINMTEYTEWKGSQGQLFASASIDIDETKKMLNDYSNCSTCSEPQKDFLIPLLEKMIDSTNEELLGHIDDFVQMISNSIIDNDDKSTLLFLGFVFRATAEEAIIQNGLSESTSGFWDCFGGSVGSNAGMGMAGGFLTGCGVGGINGALGGTVLFPGLGTVAGAVGGCIIGGLYGAISGGIFGAAVSAASCLFN